METTTQQETVTLTIDGKTVTVPKGTVVVDAAKTVDIEIPIFCYHEKLGPFGCCRMCLVEVEKMPKLTTACTLMANNDMVVKTTTEKVVKAQQGVLEFTLLNHPLDCPVCDKGGECPLQDNTFKFGPPDTRMEYNRQNRDKATPLSPVITIDRERCIACQRCTRYSEIIEKDQALVMLNRGFQNKVATFNDQPYDTRFSGNVIDICPVGALTNTDFRFTARAWDLTNASTLCGHCGCNCNMTLGIRLNEMKRITTRPNDAVDDGWICDKARWGYDFTKSKNRIQKPRKQGEALTIQDACQQVAEGLKKIVEQHGADSVGFIGSGYGLNEELYLYQKLFRTRIGTNNIDHKTYLDTPGLPVPQWDLPSIEAADLVLLIASDPTEELPILDLRIKKAVTRLGVKLAILNDQTTVMDRYATPSLRYNIGSDATVFSALSAVLAGQSAPGLESTGLESGQIQSLAETLKSAKKVCVVYNPAGLTGPSIHNLKHLLSVIDQLPDTECGALPSAPATNALGAMDMGVLPGFYPGGLPLSDVAAIQKNWGENAPVKPGLTALEMIEKAKSGELKALVVFRSNPVVDFPGGAAVTEALQKLELLLVHDIMETETAQEAHFVIPSNGPGFDEGTTTNIGGRVQQRTRGLVSDNPHDWKIISMIAKEFGDETLYKNVFEVTAEIAEKVNGYAGIKRKELRRQGKNRGAVASVNGSMPAAAVEGGGAGSLKLRVAHSLFCHDKILDASSPLAHQFKPSSVHLHERDAAELGVTAGDEVTVFAEGWSVKAEAVISNRCNPGGVVLPKISDEQGVMGLTHPRHAVQWVQIKK